MIVAICVDEKNGMMFHGRRQSQDRILREDLLQECGESRLFMNEYSAGLFWDNAGTEIVVSEEFLRDAQEGDFCFAEDAEIGDYLQKTEAVILYKWNRRYPADVYLSANLWDGKWKLEKTEEFRGSSHERITKEVYRRYEEES